MLEYDTPESSVVFCNWKNHDLLVNFVESLLASLTVKTEIFANLNEASQESIDFLEQKGVRYVANKDNLGTAAVDQVTHLLTAETVATINDDEIPYFGWQTDLITLQHIFWPCCPSVTCVEPQHTGNNMVVADDCGHILDPATYTKYITRCQEGAYYRPSRLGYQHPTLYSTEAWKAIGGYSCGLPFDYFGLAGYCLDDYFNYKMKKYLGEDTKFIVSGSSFCYHQISHTTKQLPPEVKNFDAHSKFVQLAGQSTQEFRRSINWGKEI